jgi:DUF917 family protein
MGLCINRTGGVGVAAVAPAAGNMTANIVIRQIVRLIKYLGGLLIEKCFNSLTPLQKKKHKLYLPFILDCVWESVKLRMAGL